MRQQWGFGGEEEDAKKEEEGGAAAQHGGGAAVNQGFCGGLWVVAQAGLMEVEGRERVARCVLWGGGEELGGEDILQMKVSPVLVTNRRMRRGLAATGRVCLPSAGGFARSPRDGVMGLERKNEGFGSPVGHVTLSCHIHHSLVKGICAMCPQQGLPPWNSTEPDMPQRLARPFVRSFRYTTTRGGAGHGPWAPPVRCP